MTQNNINIKRAYEKPSMKVYELKHQPQLLQSSGLPTGDEWPGGEPW